MLDMDQYRKRVAQLYSNERTRWRKVLGKGLPKGVKLDIPSEQVLPYSQAALGKWLWSQIQLGAICCPYCNAAIDVLSMELDHKTPLRRGGGPELSNKQVICRKCNGSKGDFSHEEYSAIVTFMRGEGAYFRQRLEGVLRNGGVGLMMQRFPRQPKGGKARAVQSALGFDDLGTF